MARQTGGGSFGEQTHEKLATLSRVEVGGVDACEAFLPTGRYGLFFPLEWNTIAAKKGFRKVVCTGKAGTLIFGDFRGVHHGQPHEKGRRVLLNNTFGISLDGLL